MAVSQPEKRVELRLQPKIGNNGTQPKGSAGPKPPPNGKPVATKPVAQPSS
jgi:hypothetical protein